MLVSVFVLELWAADGNRCRVECMAARIYGLLTWAQLSGEWAGGGGVAANVELV